MTLPLGQAVPQIVLDAGRGLVSFLGGLGEQLHDNGRDRLRHGRKPLGGRHRTARDMAVHPLHGIAGGERQGAGEHLVECDAQSIEIAAGINRTVHPAGLLWCHVRERAGDGFRRLWRLSLAGKAGSDAEPREPYLAALVIHQDMGRLQVLVDETALMELGQRRGDADGEVEEPSRLGGSAEKPVERRPPWILKH